MLAANPSFITIIDCPGRYLSSYNRTGIARKMLAERHQPVPSKTDTLCSLLVGKGKFACMASITGFQTFSSFAAYEKAVRTGTATKQHCLEQPGAGTNKVDHLPSFTSWFKRAINLPR